MRGGEKGGSLNKYKMLYSYNCYWSMALIWHIKSLYMELDPVTTQSHRKKMTMTRSGLGPKSEITLYILLPEASLSLKHNW